MELRVLRYFLAVAREENISRAAEALHTSQPSLSRQLKELEEELGKTLFLRGRRKITLTEEGMFLRKRAEEIIDLVDRTTRELTLTEDMLAGDVYIGAGETEGMRLIAQAAGTLAQSWPDIHLHIVSGDRGDIVEQLDKGLIDFAVLVGKSDAQKKVRVSSSPPAGYLERSDAKGPLPGPKIRRQAGGLVRRAAAALPADHGRQSLPHLDGAEPLPAERSQHPQFDL